jgi:hypothetical protein
MKTKPLIIFVSILAVISAVIFFTKDRPSSDGDPRVGNNLVDPQILRETTSLILQKGDRTVTLKMLDDEAHWIVSEYFDFPINFQNLTRLGSALDKAKIKRFATSNPERMGRLEFGKEKIEILTKDETPALTIHLGKNVSNRGRFVRLNDEEKAYLSDLSHFIDVDAKNWAEDNLTDLTLEQIAEFSIETPGEKNPLLFKRLEKDAEWEIASSKEEDEKPLKDDIESILKKMTQLRFVDTTPLDAPNAIDAANNSRKIHLKTFDGHDYAIRIGQITPSKEEEKDTAEEAEENTQASDRPKPVFVWIESSQPDDPVNQLMAKRAFIISTYIYTALPSTRGSLIENTVAEEPVSQEPVDSTTSSDTTEPSALTPSPEEAPKNPSE